MAYASITKPSLHFNTKLYTGNGSTQSITGVGFQPDYTWTKLRSTSSNHMNQDAVRGSTKHLHANTADSEVNDTNGVTSFDTDGFSVGSNGNVNNNSSTIVSWNWKANGSGSSNTDGNATATVSANTTAGFSIVKWSSNGQEQSIGHGLGVTPSMIIMKTRNTGDGWIVGHKDNGWAYYQVLQGTNAKISDDRMFSPSGGSDPTNSLWWTNSAGWVTGGSTNCIAYCFAEKKGYSKFGSYIGNGNADGVFVYTGFKPAFVMCKRSDGGTQNWCIMDNKRGLNPDVQQLHPNTDGVETLGSGDTLDLLSNGFKMRANDGDKNGSDETFIYMAIAEEPLVANVGESIPATAR